MVAPIVRRLSEQVLSSQDEEQRACYSLELAAYHARAGDFDAAEAIRQKVRASFGSGRSPAVSIRLMCLEGVLAFFQRLDPLARDRIYRANVLSTALQQRALVALTAAWLAHMDFNLNRFEDLRADLRSALDAISSDDLEAKCRVALVLADAFLYAHDFRCSRTYYQWSHSLAVRIGDRAAIAAMTYNSAAMKISALRVMEAMGQDVKQQLDFARIEVEGAVKFQYLAGLTSLPQLLESIQCSYSMLKGEFAEALTRLEDKLPGSRVDLSDSTMLPAQGDRIRCLAELRRTATMRNEILQLEDACVAIEQSDERLILCYNLARAYQACRLPEDALRCERRIESASIAHRAQLEALRETLSRYVEVPQVLL